MKYLIMECHMAYAVVLDEDGRFLKAANRTDGRYHYGNRRTRSRLFGSGLPV